MAIKQSRARSSAIGILALILALGTLPAHGAVIGFDDVVGPDGTQFTPYTEDGFTVTPDNDRWIIGRGYGNPAPFVYFLREQSEGEVVSGLSVTAGGSDFTFGSAVLDGVDVYSSITRIPFRIRGSRDSATFFDLEGTVPNTFGNFATIVPPVSVLTVPIDTLYIQLGNPFVECCSNPVGLDNIFVTIVSGVPEPATQTLVLLSLAGMAVWRLARERERRRIQLVHDELLDDAARSSRARGHSQHPDKAIIGNAESKANARPTAQNTGGA